MPSPESPSHNDQSTGQPTEREPELTAGLTRRVTRARASGASASTTGVREGDAIETDANDAESTYNEDGDAAGPASAGPSRRAKGKGRVSLTEDHDNDNRSPPAGKGAKSKTNVDTDREKLVSRLLEDGSEQPLGLKAVLFLLYSVVRGLVHLYTFLVSAHSFNLEDRLATLATSDSAADLDRSQRILKELTRIGRLDMDLLPSFQAVEFSSALIVPKVVVTPVDPALPALSVPTPGIAALAPSTTSTYHVPTPTPCPPQEQPYHTFPHPASHQQQQQHQQQLTTSALSSIPFVFTLPPGSPAYPPQQPLYGFVGPSSVTYPPLPQQPFFMQGYPHPLQQQPQQNVSSTKEGLGQWGSSDLRKASGGGFAPL